MDYVIVAALAAISGAFLYHIIGRLMKSCTPNMTMPSPIPAPSRPGFPLGELSTSRPSKPQGSGVRVSRSSDMQDERRRQERINNSDDGLLTTVATAMVVASVLDDSNHHRDLPAEATDMSVSYSHHDNHSSHDTSSSYDSSSSSCDCGGSSGD
jgi:hypothetical protein